MAGHTSASRTVNASTLSLSTISTLFLALPALVRASFDCSDVVAKGQHFNFKELGGQYQLHWLQEPDELGGIQHNYTFHLDVCGQLKRPKGATDATYCPHGTRICGIDNEIDLETGNTTIHPHAIAGTYTTKTGWTENAQFTLLRNSKSHSDAAREGVRAELHGGRYPFKKDGMDQQAIIEFVCDKDRDGLGGDEKDDGPTEDDGEKQDGEKDGVKLRKREESEGSCHGDADLRFCGYEAEKGDEGKSIGTLRLEWRTKYACEGAQGDSNQSSHWGFFTWFIIILFLATAAYLIFGSWLNYNRYGARGWDLLPHGDTIRDIPYIVKDLGRRVAGSMQGGGSRGGYSAV